VSSHERDANGTRAVYLRLAGLSRSQIARALGLRSGGGALDRWLRGTPAPAWTKRPRAKDHLRRRAIELRREGRSYREIETLLGVSRSSLSLWLKDIPLTEERRAALADRKQGAVVRRAAAVRASRARDRRLVQEAVDQIGHVTEGELFVAGVVAYWAEGAKTKPWRARERVEFINSDPGMVLLFLRWLDLIGIPRTQLTYRVSIHEAADVDGALRFWSGVVQAPPDGFLRTSLKRHNPRTTRKNVGDGYHGCLTVSVRRSTDLNSRIQGWFEGIVGRSEELSSAGTLSAEN
jgi:transcriptional regulator with XRE-family HTH domain